VNEAPDVTAAKFNEALFTVILVGTGASGTTVNVTPLLVTAPTVTVTFPVVAPLGTRTVMLVADHAVGGAVTPLNRTVLVPCADSKFVPVIVTGAPTAPFAGDTAVMVGGPVTSAGTTVNVTPLLATPPTVTVRCPVVAPLGTCTPILVADHDVGVAVTPLNRTVLVPCVDPKCVPVIVTDAFTAPLVDDSDAIVGGTVTVNITPLLDTPPTVTVTFPVVAPLGTATVMLVADQDVGVAVTPLMLTALVPCVGPKFVPVIVMNAFTAPLVGDSAVIVAVGAGGPPPAPPPVSPPGAGSTTVNVTPLLDTPPTVTVTVPVVAPLGTGTVMLVADHDVGVVVTPLNLTRLAPCVAPKFVPPIVTIAPAAPVGGDSNVIVGAGAGAGVVTVKVAALLATPATVTVTLPVVAPLGTGVTMRVGDQDVGVAVTPLNFTTLVPWVAPKFVPVIVVVAPTAPLGGDSERIMRRSSGVATTVNVAPLLDTPSTVTVTFPVVAPLGT
jgi:hypothetical protein